jgi:anti-sigma factor RsiW
MDHADAVRMNATERYLLNELDTAQLEQFEEHMFECQECALDVHAASMFIEQSKNVLAKPALTPVPVPQPAPAPVPNPWFAWLRPTIAVPAMAVLLFVVLFQNLVTYPRLESALHQPQVMPWAAVNVGTWGAGGPAVTAKQGQGFLLFVRIPPESGYKRYTADLHNPAGKLEWSLTFPVTAGQDQWPMQVPGSQREPGTYTLNVRGITAAGEIRDLGRTSFDLQIQN